MTNQELIQEAAVIRDERNQYANTAERVGTALVHMAEQIAAQAADVDKVEEDVRGSLTLAQLDNPFGFTTVAQWMQGLRGEQSYTFRLVAPTGRCIGHVWLFNDYDNPHNNNSAARTLEVVMCCATINADTGALTYNAINGSPRIYYRSYCAPLTGGTPDGGLPVGNKWSLWQEYREYVTKPIKNALAALQQQHATDVADLQAKHATDVADLQASINATLAAIPTGVLNLGMSADADTILSEAAKYAVVSDPFKAVITGQYMVGTAVQSIVIHQQVTKSSDGSGVCMQYVYKDKARFTRYINFNAAAKVTAVQGLQPDGVRNLYYTDTGFIGQRDMWSTQVGSGFFLPNKNDLREGTPTATTVPLVLTKAIKDTVTCNLGAATTARAGVMTVEQVQQLADAGKALQGVDVSAYSYAFRYMGNLVDEDSVKAKDKLVRLLNSYCTTADDLSLSEIFAIYKSSASELLPFTGTLRGQVNGVPFTVRQNTSSWGNFYTQTLIGPFVFSGGYFNTASGVEHTWVRSIDTSGSEVNFGDWYEPLAAIPTGVLNLGMTADADTILSEAAKYAVVSDPFKAVITAQYMVGTAVQSIVIHQQVTKSSDGSGVCMQYVYKDKARYTRYINFNAAAKVTAVQGLQPDGVRDLYYTDTGFIGHRDAWGTQVGSGFFLPNKNDLREGTPTATSVPLVLTKAIKDTVTCNLGPATTARAGVMTVEQVKQLADAKAKADKEAGSHYYLEGTYADLDEIIEALKELPEVLTDERVRYIHATSPDDYVYEVFIFKIMDVMVPYGGTYNVSVTCYAFSNIGIGNFSISYDVDEATGSFSLGICSGLSSIESFGLKNQTNGDRVNIGLTNLNGEVISTIQLDVANTGHGGIMSAAHVQKLANLEARIAALEAK